MLLIERTGIFFAEKPKERTVNRISVIDGHKYRLLLEVRTNWATSKYTLQKHSYDTVYALITMRIIYYRWFEHCNRIQFIHSTNLIRPKKIAQLNRSISFFCRAHRWHKIFTECVEMQLQFWKLEEKKDEKSYTIVERTVAFFIPNRTDSSSNNFWMSRICFSANNLAECERIVYFYSLGATSGSNSVK